MYNSVLLLLCGESGYLFAAHSVGKYGIYIHMCIQQIQQPVAHSAAAVLLSVIFSYFLEVSLVDA